MPSSISNLLDYFESDFEEDAITDDMIRNFIETELKIRDKETNRIIPFHFNPIQNVYWAHRTDNDYILKYRKGGFSTLTMAEYFTRAVLIPNQQIILLAHRQESTNLIFQTMHLFYKNLSEKWLNKITAGKGAHVQSKNELRFKGNDSQIIALTGASQDTMRGLTPTCVHISEIAFWKPEWVDEATSSVLGSIPPNGVVRMETTPSGAGSWAYEEWQHAVVGDSRFVPHFFAWWDDTTNRIKGVKLEDLGSLNEREQQLVREWHIDAEQLAWRRAKEREQRGKFKREFPEDSETCWLRSGSTVFDMEKVTSCYGGIEPKEDNPVGLTVYKQPDPTHTYVIGADPAEGNEDGDFSAAIGIDEQTGEQVFEYYHRLPIHDFGEVLYNLGMRYNEACLSIERNNHGHAVIQYLELVHPYPYLFVEDDGKVGIQTTQASKSILISILDRFFWEAGLVLHGRMLFRQLSSYVYDDHKKAGASGNGHDDLVSSLLCASFAFITNHPRSKEPKQLPPERPSAPPTPVIDVGSAAQLANKLMHYQSGIPMEYPKVGCHECGCTYSILVNGMWVCEQCRKEVQVTRYAFAY